VLILAILGQRTLGAHLERVTRPATVESKLWMSASRISDVTGLPRETVRRKLSKLTERGWITRSAKGSYSIAVVGDSSHAKHDLEGLEARQLDRLVRLYLALSD
jgi:DNA-binding IclR family transcriptional regulator